MELSAENYCKLLGHHVPFSYCLKTPDRRAEGILCSHVRNCWFERFDIDSYLEENFDKNVIEGLGPRSSSKMTSLLDLISQAKERQDRTT